MSAYQLPVWVWPAVLVATCALALLRGRDEERLAAATVLLGWALSMVAFRNRSEDTQWLVLLIDGTEMPVFIWLALRTRRYWPLFAAAFKLLIVVTHLAHVLDPTITGWAYLTAVIIWSYLAVFAIGYGAWTAPAYAINAADPTEGPGATLR